MTGFGQVNRASGSPDSTQSGHPIGGVDHPEGVVRNNGRGTACALSVVRRST